jgi:hypothetical protein
MSLSKAFLAETYKAMKEATGHEPTVREFCKKTGISTYNLQKSFGCNWWSKLVIAAGDKPKTFASKRITNNELLKSWGEFVRKINRIPRQADWHFFKFKPTANTYGKRFGGLTNTLKEFRKFAQRKSGWRDVIALLDKEKPAEPEDRLEYLFKKDIRANYKNFIPNVLNDFELLSKSESCGLEAGVALVYQFMGFDVVKLGINNGRKRDPDGIAYNKGGYAIIYDAKSRKTGYNIKTDDRRIIEYINKYRDRIKREGCSKIYFQIISSRFNGRPLGAVKNVKKETQVQLTLIKASDLLRLLSKKIEQPLSFNLSRFEELLLENGVIESKKVERFLMELE